MKATLRLVLAAASIAVVTFATAGAASAAPLVIAPIAVSEELAEEFTEDFGERERQHLQELVYDALADALTAQGAQIVDAGAPLILEATIVSADPNKPTMKQLSDTPGLDYFYSVSIGGAEINGVLRRANGEVVSETHYRRYSTDLREAYLAAGTWSDARRAARGFARRVADDYIARSAMASSAQ